MFKQCVDFVKREYGLIICVAILVVAAISLSIKVKQTTSAITKAICSRERGKIILDITDGSPISKILEEDGVVKITLTKKQHR